MGTLTYLIIALCVVWTISEVFYALRKHSKGSSHSTGWLNPLLMYVAVPSSGALAVVLKVAPATGALGKVMILSPSIGYIGCALIAFGLVFRWVAVATLGEFFTVDGAFMPDHRIIDKGLYGVVRHPSYLGALLMDVGFGLALENWLSLVVMLLFPAMAQLYRISVEEKALLGHFGSAYRDYMRRTKKLIPGIF
ncbi:MAG TPA: isoprenylcysteine carboxylmethyltransferase family protein [Spirochaetia bacterium]|nr:isoprenylcysteine carboxylmethyltransferase family protein [Spirochaetia bacterium]